MKDSSKAEIRLKVEPIHYLDVDNLRRFASVTLISRSGDKVQVNPVILAAFNPNLVANFHDESDDEHYIIITEFDIQELEMIVNFCHGGILPEPLSKLQHSVPKKVALVFEAFGIYLDQLLFQPWRSFSKTSLLVVNDVKAEVVLESSLPFKNIKTENPASEIDIFDKDCIYNDDNNDQDDFDEDVPLAKKKRGRPKKIKDEDQYDMDWNPTRKLTPKIKKERILNGLESIKTTKQEEITARARSSMIQHCLKLQEQFKGAVNVQFPCEELGDMSLLKTYQLPNPLESYIRPPRVMPKRDTFLEDQSKPIKCVYCVKRFMSKVNHKTHVAKHHSEHYECQFCHRVVPIGNTKAFKKHMFRHEHVTKLTTPHECVQCGFSHFRKENMVNHMNGAGPFHDNQCTQCTERFKTYEEHKSHIEADHTGKWLYKCGQCKDLFEIKDDVMKHRIRVHRVQLERVRMGRQRAPVAKKICDICGKELKYSLEKHLELKHSGTDENIPCPECGKTFRKQILLTCHIQGVHAKIPCTICGMMVAKARRWRHHQQNHTAEQDRKYKCEQCGKGFSDRARLKDHVNIHTGAKPYVCKFCANTFASKGNHRMHERSHLGHKRSK
jgi:hypothetical protein